MGHTRNLPFVFATFSILMGQVTVSVHSYVHRRLSSGQANDKMLNNSPSHCPSLLPTQVETKTLKNNVRSEQIRQRFHVVYLYFKTSNDQFLC
jgi:hypothetical protein